MNKIAIPALMVAAVMIAGIFAFAPVEQASTTHALSGSGPIVTSTTSTILDDDSADTHTITYTFSDDALVYGMHIELGTTESTDNWDILTVTSTGLALNEDTAFSNPSANNDIDQAFLQTNAFESIPLVLQAGETIVLAIAEEDTTDGATSETLTVTFTYTANDGTSISTSAVVVT